MNEQLATMFQAWETQPTTELEVNIMLRTAGRFLIPFEIAHQIATKLKKRDDILCEPVQKYVDCFYGTNTNGNNITNNIRVRSVLGQKTKHAIRKTQIIDIHARCSQLHQFVFHFTLRNELPIELPQSVAPHFVRMQEVWEFNYQNTFLYVVKKVASGPTKHEACQNPHNWELEIEVLRDSPKLKELSNLEKADYFISKALGFLPRKSQDEILTLELNNVPKTLQQDKDVRLKRKYVSKKKLAKLEEWKKQQKLEKELKEEIVN